MGCVHSSTAVVHPVQQLRTVSSDEEVESSRSYDVELGMNKISDADLVQKQKQHHGDVSHNLQNRWIRSHFYGGPSQGKKKERMVEL